MATSKQTAPAGNSQSSSESINIKRITVAGIEYESGSGTNGDYVTINGQEASMEDVQALSSFFGRQMRIAGNGNQQKATDGRGEVLHPETDARVKGNESLRKNDPTRAASNGQKAKAGNR